MSNPERQPVRDQIGISHRLVNFRTFLKSPIVVLVCVALLLLFAGAASSGGNPAISQKEGKSSIDNPVSTRLIPDQKALLGTTVTTIDLQPLLSRSELGKSGEPISVSILKAKKDVAEASIENMILTLEWKKKTGKKREVLIEASIPSGQTLRTRFYVELWQPDYWKMVFTVIGGLGLFLLGMTNMSNGLQAIAGNGLRKMIGWVTGNRFSAIGVGTLMTMLVQSSSITTVTVIGFVNSGFMTLVQSIGVIMGANIGTTITGWILVLKIGKYGLPIAGVAALVFLFSKRDRIRFLAMTIMGLGLIFFGLELMKDGFSVVRELPDFERWFHTFSADSYVGILKCAAVGCILTFVVQSSSATLGITIGLAQLGVIEFETAAALVLGENIGTTITAWLASFGASINAKRAAYFHCIFNVLGVLWITAIFHSYLMLIRYFVVGDTAGVLTVEATSAAAVTAAIAATHTGFNIANTVFFLPFTNYLAKFLETIIPGSASETDVRVTSLDKRTLDTPSIAIEQSRSEVVRMAENCDSMLKHVSEIGNSESSVSIENEIFRLEEVQDEMQVEVISFMSDLMTANLTHEIIDEGRQQLRLVDEYESVSDDLASIVKAKRRLQKRELQMPESEQADIKLLHQNVSNFMQSIHQALVTNNASLLDNSVEEGREISKLAKSLNKQLLKRAPEDRLSPFITSSYTRQIACYRSARDHLVNISEVLKGEK